MSTVTSVNGSAPVGPADINVVDAGQLSPDALMAFCSVQLRGMDNNIKLQMEKQQNAQKFQEALTALRRLMSQGQLNPQDAMRKKEILEAFRAAYAACPDSQRGALETAFNDFRSTACLNDGRQDKELGSYTDSDMTADFTHVDSEGKNLVVTDEFDKLDKQLESIGNNVSKNAELEMINLQSLMSQRQTIVSMTTNMMNKVNETLQSVTNNIK